MCAKWPNCTFGCALAHLCATYLGHLRLLRFAIDAKRTFWMSFGSFVRQFRSSEVPEGRDVCQMAKLHIWVRSGSFVRHLFGSSEAPEVRDRCKTDILGEFWLICAPISVI